MEGVGVWDEVPCVVVKGVCDYPDCHKQKGWQNFGAATTDSAAEALLERYTQTYEVREASSTSPRRTASDAVQDAQQSIGASVHAFGPITGHNVVTGSSIMGGTVTYHFNKKE
ncbi:hypothetical protein jhhlp_001701 [Lomentospora prolificans]|uniref:Uncharacterized protein n=1 Tax=Lomentospora prolificans TaxID=41688 RepID=A0A2N3NH01_9PEZI|nr:hypothetical protein jhhlp_001701 [Lomentospora prolificans]